MIKKEFLGKQENAVIFYRVDANGTLNYLANTKNGVFENEITVDDMHAIIQKNGNSKTGKEWLLNTLPGENPIATKDKGPITNVKGTCQGCCDGCEAFCYAINGCKNHHNSVMPSVIKNTVLWRLDPERFEAEIDEQLSAWKIPEFDEDGKPNHKVFRWHASGEIEGYQYFLMMMRIAEKHPEVHFYSYTKRFKLIEKYLDDFGDFPSNFVMNLSVWESNLIDSGFNLAYLTKVQCFEWTDNMSVEEYNSPKTIRCNSVDYKGGKKGHLNHNSNCRECGLCWKGKCKGRTIYVYNH